MSELFISKFGKYLTFKALNLNLTSLTIMFHYVKIILNTYLGKLNKFCKILDIKKISFCFKSNCTRKGQVTILAVSYKIVP